MVAIGGVRRDWQRAQVEAIESTLAVVEREFRDLAAIIQSSNSTRDRLERTGILRPEKASVLGIVGVAGRASGVDLDLRRDHPYEAYRHLSFSVPVYQAGDVRHRLQVRIDEVSESIQMIRAVVSRLPDGPHRAPAQPIPPNRCALSAVEGWRGEIIHWVRTGEGNRLRTLQGERSVHQQLAGHRGSGGRQYRGGFSSDQQELQLVLFGDGSVTRCSKSCKIRSELAARRPIIRALRRAWPSSFADARSSTSIPGPTRAPRQKRAPLGPSPSATATARGRSPWITAAASFAASAKLPPPMERCG